MTKLVSIQLNMWGPSPQGLMKSLIVLALIIGLTGCTSLVPQKGFKDVQQSVMERVGQQVYWKTGGPEDQKVAAQVKQLLQRQMTLQEVIQVALLNNSELQATYEQMGIAQADLVQAGLLSNPVFNGALRFLGKGQTATLEIDVSQDFLSILIWPLRKKHAALDYEAAKLHLTQRVIDFVFQIRQSYYTAQANLQAGDMMSQVVTNITARLTAAQALHDAGNINDLALDRQKVLHEEARLALTDAKTALLKDRERLNILMGLWGEEVNWQMAKYLAEVPEDHLDTRNITQWALDKSIDLATGRLKIESLAQSLGLAKVTSFIPNFELGYSGEREDKVWGSGPAISLTIPLFDMGQAKRFRVASELRQAQWHYKATVIKLRAASRSAASDLRQSRTKVDHLSQIMLPLRQKIIDGMMLEFNAMQIGVFRLLEDQRRQIETGRDYIGALREYWRARANVEQLLSGSLAGFPLKPENKGPKQ